MADTEDLESLYEDYLREEENRYELHRHCAAKNDWNITATASPPAKPAPIDCTSATRSRIASYQPNSITKWLGLAGICVARMERTLEIEIRTEQESNQSLSNRYQEDFSTWKSRTTFAKRIIDGEVKAYQKVLEEAAHLKEIPVGTSMNFNFCDSSTLTLTLDLLPQSHFPTEEHRLTKTGKLSTKTLSQSAMNERHLRHVCSAVLRMTAELFALLPFDTILATGKIEWLDLSTGNTSEQPIISAIMTREDTQNLNYQHLDPVETLKNFKVRLDYRVRRGFAPVEPLTSEDTA